MMKFLRALRIIIKNAIPWIHGQATEPADTDEKPNDSWTIFED
jgi:hypothetical protein